MSVLIESKATHNNEREENIFYATKFNIVPSNEKLTQNFNNISIGPEAHT